MGEKGLIYKALSFTADTVGAGLGAKIGMYGSIPYSIGKEIYSIATSGQLYPLQNLAVETLALIGSCAIFGKGAVWYFSRWLK